MSMDIVIIYYCRSNTFKRFIKTLSSDLSPSITSSAPLPCTVFCMSFLVQFLFAAFFYFLGLFLVHDPFFYMLSFTLHLHFACLSRDVVVLCDHQCMVHVMIPMILLLLLPLGFHFSSSHLNPSSIINPGSDCQPAPNTFRSSRTQCRQDNPL
jgi:hypothetical protein